MKKTVAFLWEHFVLGGSEQVCYNTAKYLAERWGVKSYFIATRFAPHALKILEDMDYEYIILPEDKRGRFFMTESNIVFLQKEVQRLGIELVFYQAGALDPERPLNLPCQTAFWHHSTPLGECREKVLRARIKAERSWLKWLEFQLLTRLKYEYTPLRYRRKLKEYRQHIAQSDYYLVLCPEYAQNLCKELALPPEEASKVRSMINTQQPITPQLSKEREIIYMGRLERGQKRVDRLLYIWAKAQHRLPEWRLRIYGSGEEEAYLKALAVELNLQRCTFEGRVQYPDAAYRTASVLCMTSNYEGFPLAMVEAQCHGVVPMAFDVCAGIRYVVGECTATDGASKYRHRAGVLLPAFDLDVYAEELVALCQDDEARGQLQAACLGKVEDYALTVNDAQWLDLLS